MSPPPPGPRWGVSHTTIWKLANGQSKNPSKRLIELMAKTFGVPPAFFFDDVDEQQLGLLKDQVELLILVRDAKITSAQFRALLGLDEDGRKAVADAIARTAHARIVPGHSRFGRLRLSLAVTTCRATALSVVSHPVTMERPHRPRHERTLRVPRAHEQTLRVPRAQRHERALAPSAAPHKYTAWPHACPALVGIANSAKSS